MQRVALWKDKLISKPKKRTKEEWHYGKNNESEVIGLITPQCCIKKKTEGASRMKMQLMWAIVFYRFLHVSRVQRCGGVSRVSRIFRCHLFFFSCLFVSYFSIFSGYSHPIVCSSSWVCSAECEKRAKIDRRPLPLESRKNGACVFFHFREILGQFLGRSARSLHTHAPFFLNSAELIWISKNGRLLSRIRGQFKLNCGCRNPCKSRF